MVPKAMVSHDSSRPPVRVLIVGGGFAAVEAARALRALAGEPVRLILIPPEPVLHYRPASTLEAFDDQAPRSYDLQAIADDLRAEYHVGVVESG